MRITYDPQKRAAALEHRQLDFKDAALVFAGRTLELIDGRKDYGEVRWQTYGALNGRMVMVVWTERGEARHIISMRKCNDREARKYLDSLG